MADRKEGKLKEGKSARPREKRYQRVYKPKLGIDYSAVLDGVRHVVRMEAKLSSDDWVVRVKASGQEWHINPKSLETAEPV